MIVIVYIVELSCIRIIKYTISIKSIIKNFILSKNMTNIKSLILTSLLSCALFPSILLAQSNLETKILQKISSSSNPRESLVQWYYSIDSLYDQISKISSGHVALPKLSVLKSTLRTRLDTAKAAESQALLFAMWDLYRPNVTTKETGLSSLCKERYQLVDDRSYALNLPTALTLATLDMESSCLRTKPSNGDGVFQLTAKDYGNWALTTGEWIMMMYDFSILVSGKHSRYHTSNKLSSDNCNLKNRFLTGQTAPICLTYASLDLDSLIKHGALYNGLSWANIQWDIQPAASGYVYGRYTDLYSGSVKDGLITKVLKVVQYMRSIN